MVNRLYQFLTNIPKLIKHKANSQPYYRDRNVRKTLYKYGEELKTLRETEKKNRADLEAMILSMGEKIDGGISLARAQEVYAGLVKASEENPLIRDHIISAEVSHSLDKMTIYLLSNPDFRERLTELYNSQQKYTEAKTNLEVKRHKQMRRTVRVAGTTIVATFLAIGATYVGKGYYDRKFLSPTIETLREKDVTNDTKIEKVSEQRQSDKEAKMITDGQTSLRINYLETLLVTKTSNLTEDVSTIIARTGNYELETEKSFKKIKEDSERLEQERKESLESLTATLKTQAEKITEQDGKIKSYEAKLEEQKKVDATLIERLNQLEKTAITNSPILN